MFYPKARTTNEQCWCKTDSVKKNSVLWRFPTGKQSCEKFDMSVSAAEGELHFAFMWVSSSEMQNEEHLFDTGCVNFSLDCLQNVVIMLNFYGKVFNVSSLFCILFAFGFPTWDFYGMEKWKGQFLKSYLEVYFFKFLFFNK